MNNPIYTPPYSNCMLHPHAFPALLGATAPAAPRYSLDRVVADLPEELRTWVATISDQLNVDPGMALSTLLSGMGAAAQGGRKLRLPCGGDEPMSCFFFVLAPSLAGKGKTRRFVYQTHQEHDLARYQLCRNSMKNPATTLSNEPGSQGQQASTRLRLLILDDTSERGLLEALEGESESTYISPSEGLVALDSDLYRKGLPRLNELWDGGGKVTLRRGNNDFVFAHDARLGMLIMVQPDIFGDYLAKFGKRGHDVGFFTRCLFTIVPPNYQVRPTSTRPIGAYNQKTLALLDAQRTWAESGGGAQEPFILSPNAAAFWFSLPDQHLRISASLHGEIRNAAGRMLQNTARIAGIIHCYCGEGDEVSEESLRAAWAIVQWSLSTFIEVFDAKTPASVVTPKPTPRQKREARKREDCQIILEQIAEACTRNQESDALRSSVDIRSGLYPARFRTALMWLVDHGYVLESGQGKKARLSIVPGGYLGPVI